MRLIVEHVLIILLLFTYTYAHYKGMCLRSANVIKHIISIITIITT